MTRINQQVAMITGGNRGIGRGITERLLREGWAVSIMATRPADQAGLDELATLGKVRYTQGSVAELTDHRRFIDETVAAWGRIDALVNNAGVAPEQRLDILEATPESFDRVLAINLRGPYFLTQQVAHQMIELRDEEYDPASEQIVGTIVDVSSISAETISTNRGEYCISKAGQSMGSKLWAVRLAGEGILVYEVRPGMVLTDMTAANAGKYRAAIADGLTPIRRMGAPSDVGGTVFALVSGLMPYSTGDTIHVGGGMQLPRL